MLHDFAYAAPTAKDEVFSLLAEHGTAAAVLSGGTDLLVNIRSGIARPDYVINLKGVSELAELSFDAGQGLSIGACVTVTKLLADATVRQKYPLLVSAASQLATHQLRNRATIVGNIVTASPCGDMSSPLLCYGAEVELASASGTRTVALQEFITGVKKTVIRPEEIVQRIIVPTTYVGGSGNYLKLKRIKGHDLGVVSVAMLTYATKIRVAIGSAAPTPLLLSEFPIDASAKTIKQAARAAISPIDDVRCTKEYRAFMVEEFIERLLAEVHA
ncbi:MAG: xanthine dehydrogenase family protein subunit M [Spirochaetaceae bacterium]|nr:MAG: xanthine dehydrogenase family protein subunit M [Spirochaetaceae bacterium]